jgi:hypothetical protein
MQTRRHDKTKASEPAFAPAAETSLVPTVVSITKIEGPTVSGKSIGGAGGKVSTSKIPKPIQFPLVVILSFSLSALGYSLTHSWTKGVLAAHARNLDTWAEFGGLVGWRV